LSPSFFAVALLLFPLPFVEVSCRDRAVSSQSGLQAVYGGFSVDPFLKAAAEGEANARGIDPRQAKLAPAPLMIVYPLFLIAGAVLSLLLVPSRRRVVAGVFAGLGLACLVAQSVLGWPLVRNLLHHLAEAPTVGRDAAFMTAALVQTQLTVWFWLSVVALALAGIAPTAESWLRRALTAPARAGGARFCSFFWTFLLLTFIDAINWRVL
jgi:hypothetical protein